ncbi:MAG: hypothetical protein JJU31_12745 [Wenzhouxiangella sp.]|nr:hypothetical protein [Wenzhouxiangella sp.]MCH8477705.1 hypothetical protein [Wenzhouxiangella sp.]
MTTTRRDFIRLSGLCLFFSASGLSTGCKDRTDVFQASLADPQLNSRLIAIAASLRGVHALGQHCLDGRSTADLTRALNERLHETGAASVGQALVKSARTDFSIGRVIDFQDWLLSETECLLAALGVAVGAGGEEEASGLVYRSFARVSYWGPDRTNQGEIFNIQSDGSGAFWVRLDGDISDSLVLRLDGEPLLTTVSGSLVTAVVAPAEAQRIVSVPGQYRLELLDVARNWVQPLGALRVDPVTVMATLADGTTSRVFCQPADWGPRQAVEGQPFNQQPGGDSAIWVRIDCVPTDTVMQLGAHYLPTTLSDGVVTALVAAEPGLVRGSYPITLISESASERLLLGTLDIQGP